MPEPDIQSSLVTYVDRCLGVIEALAAAPTGLPLGTLAEQLDLPKSATHRLLQALSRRGYVEQDEQTQAYALSLKMATLAFRFLDARRLPDIAQQALDALAAAVGEYCRLALVEGDALVWVARAQGATQGLRYDPPMGRDVVLHATATGKAWLATLPEQDALRIVCARGFDTPAGFGPRVVTNVDEFRRHLDDTRKRGYALAIEEGEPGTVAIAAAFRKSDLASAPVAGTVSIAGPQIRLGAARIAEIAPLLLETTRDLAARWPLRARQSQGRAAVRDAGRALTAS
jgi:IclR family transcriptional regulator, acetate operon repressor